MGLALAVAVAWWLMLPRLRVHVDPALNMEVDWVAFREAFHSAGVARLEVVLADRAEDLDGVVLGARGGTMDVALRAPRGRNPRLGAEALRAGMTGPGGTEGRMASVYPEEIDRFMSRHREDYAAAGVEDWPSVREHLFTNTAVLEVWHAVAGGGPEAPLDADPPGVRDPDRGVVPMGRRHLPLTRGQRGRLEAMFAVSWPGGEPPFERTR